MKVALKHLMNNRWETIKNVKTISVGTIFVIVTLFNGSVKTFNKSEVKHIRQTKLYEEGE